MALRIRAWFQQERLDGQLAAAHDPWEALLRQRGRALTARRTRDAVARRLEDAIAEGSRPPRVPSAAIPVDRDAVRINSPILVGLARDLREVDRVSPTGVARARRLAIDGASPLYVGGVDELSVAVRSASAALHLGPMVEDEDRA